MTQIKLQPIERLFIEQVMGGRVGRRDPAVAAGVAYTTECGARRLSVRPPERDERAD